jgi:hypothetical protein
METIDEGGKQREKNGEKLKSRAWPGWVERTFLVEKTFVF